MYRAAIEYVGWGYLYCETMKGYRGYVVNEESAQYNVDLIDTDSDTDPDESKENTETQSVNRTTKRV